MNSKGLETRLFPEHLKIRYEQRFLLKDKILAEQIDFQWEIFKNTQIAEKERLFALDFLVYAFDIYITNPMKLNERLIELMDERKQFKDVNPEFVPGKTPQHISLEPKNLLLNKDIPNKLAKNKEILTIDPEIKRDDKDRNATYLSFEQRAKYRVLIHQGIFKKNQEDFDTFNYVAHGKQGWAAFTLNANGELSVFNHLGGRKDQHNNIFLHSSMNAGSPVIAAGELKIKDGKLVDINTYSGHYQPSIFNVYRMLEYFSSRNVDISNASVLSFNPITIDGRVLSKKIQTPIKYNPKYKTPALQIYKILTDNFYIAINQIDLQIQSYKKVNNFWYYVKDILTFSTLTEDRERLNTEFEIFMADFKLKLKNVPSMTKFMFDANIHILEEKINHFELKNNIISHSHGKTINTGRLATKIAQSKQKISDLKNQTTGLDPYLEELKKNC